MAKILVAEDEPSINRVICKNLALVGHSTVSVLTGTEAIQAAANDIDLVLLDVMLPGKDGFEVKQLLPPELPVIFVTAKATLPDKLRGLGLGAEDYIVKPFEMLELLARVQTVLHRAAKDVKRFCYRDLRIELEERRVFLREEEVILTPQEYNLLEMLLLNRNIALSREKLLTIAWGYDYAGETRTVDTHIMQLRKKLNLTEEIQTVYKIGYRLCIKG